MSVFVRGQGHGLTTLTQGSHSITIPDISQATGPIFTNFYIEPPWAEGRKVCSNSPSHMTNMAAMPVHGENLYTCKSSSLEPVDQLP